MKKILYLDDDLQLLEIFKDYTDEWGYSMETFSNQKDAFDHLKSHYQQYQVLLIDYRMPDMNGIDFIYLLRKELYFNISNIALFSSIVKSTAVQDELYRKIPYAAKEVFCLEKGIQQIDLLKSYLEECFRINSAIL